MDLNPGTRLGSYEILALLGAGGMGVVYRALDTKLNRQVAIKVLPPGLVGDEERRLRFQREAQAAAALNHPNICTIHAVESHDGVDFLVMELLEGQTLRERIGHKGMPVKELLPLAIQLGDALHVAHERGVLHRDLKPDNVVVTKQGVAKVLDFGLAKVLHGEGEGGGDRGRENVASRLDTISRQLTVQGKVFGTVAYMSPEQAKGERVTHHSDLFSFGVVLYEMATGRQPFRGKSDAETLSSIIKDEVPPLSAVTGEALAELERIIGKALEKDPQDRYHHADDMVTDLRRLKRTTDSGVQAVRSSTSAVAAARPRPLARLGIWRWPLAVALAIAAGGFAAWRARQRQIGFKPGDRILVADVENGTSRLDLGALRGVFLLMLGPNGVARFIGPDDVQEFEKSRATRAVPFIDAPLAERICRSGECTGYLTGRIEVQDGGYRLEVRVQRVGETRPAISRTAVAPGEPDLLMTIHRLCLDLRRALGEAPQRLDLPAPPGTESLAAFQAMVAVFSAEDNFAQIAIAKKAIEHDAKWALPYMHIGIGYANLGDWREFRKWTVEGRKRSAALSEMQRLIIESAFLESYYRFDEDVENLRSLQHLYPFVIEGYDWLGWDYIYIFEDPVSAEPVYRKAYELGGSLEGGQGAAAEEGEGAQGAVRGVRVPATRGGPHADPQGRGPRCADLAFSADAHADPHGICNPQVRWDDPASAWQEVAAVGGCGASEVPPSGPHRGRGSFWSVGDSKIPSRQLHRPFPLLLRT